MVNYHIKRLSASGCRSRFVLSASFAPHFSHFKWGLDCLRAAVRGLLRQGILARAFGGPTNPLAALA